MFDFESIKPQYDVLAWTLESDAYDFYLEFSSAELQQSVGKELESKSFYVFELSQTLWVRQPAGFDKIQILERICTTLEMQGYTVIRKLVQKDQLLENIKPVQSFILKR